MTGRTGGLLAVHAHPDDETLSTGALLATWAAGGRPVTVVTCTRGERGEVIPPRLAHLAGDADALATHRELELAGALAALGVTDHVFLDQVPLPDGGVTRYTDSGMVWLDASTAGPGADVGDDAFAVADLDDAARRLAAVITDRRPDVVVTYEPGGGYGHPDHVRAHDVTDRAIALAGVGAPIVLWAAQDATDLRRAVSEIGQRTDSELPILDLDGPLPAVVVDPEVLEVRVRLAPVLARIEAALRAHESQVQALQAWSDGGAASGCFALCNDVLMPLLSEESYRFAQGSPVGVFGWPVGVQVRGGDR